MKKVNKIAFEEHFFIRELPQFAMDFQKLGKSELAQKVERRLLETDGERLQLMDESGIRLSILSFTAPGVQGETELEKAKQGAQRINDWLAESIIAKYPDRYAGFAALPMQDPEAAIQELERAIKQLKFKGSMINGFTNLHDKNTGVYYDDPRYLPFWEKVQELDIPIYIHPRDSLPVVQTIFGEHVDLPRAMWGWGFETGTHALRLMLSGLFDRFPKLKIVLGHMGETLPFAIYRAENRFEFGGRHPELKKKLTGYFQDNFYVTTAGNCRTQALLNALGEVGSDRILFSTDYPYEDMVMAARWIDETPISQNDRQKICLTNAVKLFKLEDSFFL